MDKRKLADFIDDFISEKGITYDDSIAHLINALYAEIFEEEASL